MVFSRHSDDETLAARILSSGSLVLAHHVYDQRRRFFRMGGKEKGIARPTAQDYRNYGKLRKKEARQARRIMGIKK